MGGEMLCFKELTPTMRSLETLLPQMAKNPQLPVQTQNEVSVSIDYFIKLLDLEAFKAVAISSKEVKPGVFVFKNFTCTDFNSNSILFDVKQKNEVCQWTTLPADTRVAAKYSINFKKAWNTIKQDAVNAPPAVAMIVVQAEALKNQGMDPELWLSSLSGEYSFLICGETIETAEFKVVIPDKLGILSNMIKGMFPPQPDNSVILPFPINNRTPKAIFQGNSIVIVSSDKMFKKPAKTLLSKPEYQQYNACLPQKGIDYLVIDFTAAWLNSIKKQIHTGDDIIMQQLVKSFDNVKPFSLVSVGGIAPEGFFSVTASNFSLIQAVEAIQLQSFSTWLPAIQQYQNKQKVKRNIQEIKNEQK